MQQMIPGSTAVFIAGCGLTSLIKYSPETDIEKVLRKHESQLNLIEAFPTSNELNI